MRTWAKNGVRAVLLAASAAALGAAFTDTVSGEHGWRVIRALGEDTGQARRAASPRLVPVIGGALPDLPVTAMREVEARPEKAGPGRAETLRVGAPRPGARAAREATARNGTVVVLLAGAVLTLVMAAGVMINDRIRGA